MTVTYNLIYLLVVVFLAAIPGGFTCTGTPFTLHATCDNQMTLYLDGIYHLDPQWNDWTKKSSFQMTTCTKVVAIKCVNLHGGAGILVSADNGMISDESWHCTETYQSGWQLPSFVEDGLIWKTPAVYGYSGASVWSLISGISQEAKWIWTANNKTPKTVYCRKVMPPPHCIPITLHATCDNQMYLYLDGVHQADFNWHEWTKKSPFQMTTCTKVVAIKCVNLHGGAGVLASTDNGMITDESWHCTEIYQSGWQLPSFIENVSVWKKATVHGDNNGGVWSKIAGISSNAKWIWTSINRTRKTVYCRMKMHRCA